MREKLQEKIKAVHRFLKLGGRGGGIMGTEALEDHVPTQGRLARMEPRQAVESWQGLKFQALQRQEVCKERLDDCLKLV